MEERPLDESRLKEDETLAGSARSQPQQPPTPHEPIRPSPQSAEHEFLLAEYASLTSLANSRDEHADRFLTIYLILAGAPFVIYAALLREHLASVDVLDVPPLV